MICFSFKSLSVLSVVISTYTVDFNVASFNFALSHIFLLYNSLLFFTIAAMLLLDNNSIYGLTSSNSLTVSSSDFNFDTVASSTLDLMVNKSPPNNPMCQNSSITVVTRSYNSTRVSNALNHSLSTGRWCDAYSLLK